MVDLQAFHDTPGDVVCLQFSQVDREFELKASSHQSIPSEQRVNILNVIVVFAEEGALDEGLSDGAIAGIIIAVLVALGVAIGLIIYCRQKVP